MQLIYTDEAGTSEREPVTVVASVLLDADRDWRVVTAAFNQVLDRHVPPELRPGFIFHGTEVFSGSKTITPDIWPLAKRMDFFKDVLRIPAQHRLPIALGVCHRGSYTAETYGLKLNEIEHMLAFSHCMERSDYYIQSRLDSKEIAVVIAEDTPTMRGKLKRAGLLWRKLPIWVPADGIRGAPSDFPGHSHQIVNIIDNVHFAEKDQAQLMQLADACAFVFRRVLSKLAHGEPLLAALLGDEHANQFLVCEHWFSLASSGLFTQHYEDPTGIKGLVAGMIQAMQRG